MIIGITDAQKEKNRCKANEKFSTWHKHFLIAGKLEDGRWAFFQTVERKATLSPYYERFTGWVYREML